MSMMRIF